MGKIQRSKTRSVPALQFLKRSLTFKDFKGQLKDAQFLRIPYKTGLQYPCALLPHFHFSFACSQHVAMPRKRGRRASKLACLFLQISSNKINLPLEIEIYQKLWLLTPPKQHKIRKAGSQCSQMYKRTNCDSIRLFFASNNSGCSWKD